MKLGAGKEISEFLKIHGFKNINHLYNGSTPLIKAIETGNLSVFELLLKNPKIKINLYDADNRTAAFWAVEWNKPEFLELLCKYRANLLIAENQQSFSDRFYNIGSDIVYR